MAPFPCSYRSQKGKKKARELAVRSPYQSSLFAKQKQHIKDNAIPPTFVCPPFSGTQYQLLTEGC
jgi:hypothetical protein